MEMTKKKLGIALASVLMLGMVFALGVYFASVHTDLTVNEALVSKTTTCTISGYAGETKTCEIDVTNQASVPLNISIAWIEADNVNHVAYTTDMPKTLELASGDSSFVVTYVIANDSPNGLFDGDVQLARIK
jgi:hypothetical protein